MTNAAIPPGTNRRIRVVLSTTALLSFMSVSKATALVLSELAVGVFFAVGIARSFIGDSAPWFVLAACALSAFVRAIDIESWAFFVPGGLIGRAEKAFGQRAGSLATAVMLIERLLLVVLACVLCVQYAVSIGAGWIAEWSVTARLTVQEIVTVGAIFLIGLLWTRSRLRFQVPSSTVARGIWVGFLMLAALLIVGFVSVQRNQIPVLTVSMEPPWGDALSTSVVGAGISLFVGFALVLPLLGGGGSLGRTAREFAPPRVQSVRRMAFYVVFFVFILAVLSSFLFVALVPEDQANAWSATPLSGLAQFLSVPPWLIGVLTLFVLAAVLLMLIPAAFAALEDIEQLLRRLSVEGLLPGHVANSANVAATAGVLLTVASGAQVSWLSRAYGISIAVALLLRIGVNARLRKIHHEQHPFRTPVAGVIVVSGVVGLSALAILVSGDVPSIAALGSICGLGLLLAAARRSAGAPVVVEDNPFELSTAAEVSLGHVEARPDNVLIAVRHPDSLAHVGRRNEDRRRAGCRRCDRTPARC